MLTLIERATQAAAHLADGLARPPVVGDDAGFEPDSRRWDGQSLSSGAAGIALLHAARAQATGWERPVAWITAALEQQITAAGGAALWHGAPAVAFALDTAARLHAEPLLSRLDTAVARLVRARLEEAHRRIDAATRPDPGEFDLVRGLTGLGALFLRRDPHGLLPDVLTYLVRLTEPIPAADPAGLDAPGWWTGRLPVGRPPARYLAGHSDQGMAHGITGPLALLAHACRAGVTVDGQTAAIAAIRRWLEQWRQDGLAGAWWPERITCAELATGRCHRSRPARPSWCYGTPGITRALQLAALATGDGAGGRCAEDTLLRCVTDPAQLDLIDNPNVCHGWAGLVATVMAVAAEGRNPELPEQIAPLAGRLLSCLETNRPGKPGLIDGTAGPALLLHDIGTGRLGHWAYCLLLTGAPS